MNFLNLLFFFLNCCHTSSHRQEYVHRNRRCALFTADKWIHFLLAGSKRSPGKACGYLGQTRWLKISYSTTYSPLLLVYWANRSIKVHSWMKVHSICNTYCNTSKRWDSWGGAAWVVEFTWEGVGGKAAWETLTYCLSITKNYTLWKSIRSF